MHPAGSRVHPGQLGSLHGVRYGRRRVHPWSLASLGCDWMVVKFIWGRWVHWGAPWGLSGSYGVAGFFGVLSGARMAHPNDPGLTRRPPWLTPVNPTTPDEHQGSPQLTQ